MVIATVHYCMNSTLQAIICCVFVFFSCIIKVDSAWNSGNYEEARRNANIAKILNFIGIGVGIAGWVGVGIYVIVQIVISVGIAASSVS